MTKYPDAILGHMKWWVTSLNDREKKKKRAGEIRITELIHADDIVVGVRYE